jgi:hypothetical protein
MEGSVDDPFVDNDGRFDRRHMAFSLQHRFETARWVRREEWDPANASMEGSSWLDVPRVLPWLTGNIGFHHVYHLNPRVPNYRLGAEAAPQKPHFSSSKTRAPALAAVQTAAELAAPPLTIRTSVFRFYFGRSSLRSVTFDQPHEWSKVELTERLLCGQREIWLAQRLATHLQPLCAADSIEDIWRRDQLGKHSDAGRCNDDAKS